MDSQNIASTANTTVQPRPTTVSGLYRGDMMLPQPGRFELELRVDIDPRNLVSPVMNRISGDLYQVTRTNLPGQPPQTSRTYIESWIVDHPQLTPAADHIDVAGDVRYWTGTHAATTVALRITWPGSPPAVAAEVTFTETGGATRRYSCRRASDNFRNVELEVDVCASVNRPPLLPVYDTSWHDNHPADLPHRVLTVESAYQEAGVNVTIRPDHTVINDTAPKVPSWTPAELHDAMETNFSQYRGTWPNWQMWALVAGNYEDSRVGGIMFDAAAVLGGDGTAPERKGFAVFRNHEWFSDLAVGTPQNQEQAAAARQILYAWVHEAGHAYNFMHSWDKGRPDSLSWMNYSDRYDDRNGVDTFWKRFAFRFDDDELIHLRHGNRASVIMGGDPWSSGSHLESPNLSMTQIEGKAPLELIVRSKDYFDFMEPVIVELRLRNLLTDTAVMIDKRFAPEYGGVAVYIQKPDGHVVQYDPLICAVGKPETLLLAPDSGAQGNDRYSREIFLSYGSSNFYFDRPGEYRIRAVYQGLGDVLIPSDTHRIRIGAPLTREIDRSAQDYFTDEVGLTLYLKGSRSPYLAKGSKVLEDMAERYGKTELGAKIAMTLADGVSRPFYRVKPPEPRTAGAPAGRRADSAAIVQSATADPQEALDMTKSALDLYQKDKSKVSNLAYRRIVERRADYHEAAGTPGQAKQELEKLARDLSARGANAPVVNRYRLRANNMADSGEKQPAAAPSRVRATAAPRKKGRRKPRGRST